MFFFVVFFFFFFFLLFFFFFWGGGGLCCCFLLLLLFFCLFVVVFFGIFVVFFFFFVFFFHFSPIKQLIFKISYKLPLGTICMKCQILFSGKNKKNVSIWRLLKFYPKRGAFNVDAFFRAG